MEPALKKRAKISQAETERRREIVYRADRSNELEGGYRSPETDAIFEAYIHGEIEVEDLTAKVKAFYGLK